MAALLNSLFFAFTNSFLPKGSSIIVIIFTSVHSVRLGEGVKGDRTLFLNVVYSDGNEIIAHVRRTSMTKKPLVRNSLLVQTHIKIEAL